jgi:hypothetical protein
MSINAMSRNSLLINHGSGAPLRCTHPEIQVLREKVFLDWLQKNPRKTPRDITRLHLNGSVNDPANNFVMFRDRVRTVSITQVVHQKKYARMIFLELLENNRDERLVSVRNR